MEPKKNLMQLVADAQRMAAALMESGGELSAEFEAELKQLDLDMSDKVEGYAYRSQALTDLAASMKARADEFNAAAAKGEQVAASAEGGAPAARGRRLLAKRWVAPVAWFVAYSVSPPRGVRRLDQGQHVMTLNKARRHTCAAMHDF
jgi:hypothetical protein